MSIPVRAVLSPESEAPLLGARVQAVHQPDAATVVLETHRSEDGVSRWMFSVRPDTARLGQSFTRRTRGGPPPVFCQWLRSRLEGARVASLEAWHPQVLALRLERPPAPGADADAVDAVHHLVLELNRRESNLLLLDGARHLLIALRRPSLPGRKLGPGDVYRLPDPIYAWPEPPGLEERYPATGEAAARSRERDWRGRERDAALAGRRGPAMQAARREVKRLGRRLENLAEDLRAAEAAEDWRRRGELLQIHRAQMQPGARSVTVQDIFRPDAPLLEIPLDPTAEPGANIERCFHRFRKLRDALPHVRERMAATEAERDRWQAVLGRIEAAPDAAALESLGRALPTEMGRLRGLLRGDEPAARGAASEAPRGLLCRLSADGWTILVGRSKVENDQVTFRLGRGRDWWLHVQGRPGSHVIILSPRGEAPPPVTLREAAWLAGYYSQVRGEGQVDVDYTQRKYVRKVKGGEPGQVTYSQHKTVLVNLDDAALRMVLERVPEEGPGGRTRT